MKSLKNLNRNIIKCQACPRLRTHCATLGKLKRKQFQNEVYWGKPVPGFGCETPKLWIIGLAPGAHGANRTGRVFTGDNSGNWLYSALHRFGLSSQSSSLGTQDGLTLYNTYISCVCRCAPPNNRPTQKEIDTCSPFLISEWELLKHPPVVLALGRIAFDNVLRLLIRHYSIKKRSDWKFHHGAQFRIGQTLLMASYHPSQQNTFTKKLTLKMWNNVFSEIKRQLEGHPLSKN